MLDQIICGSTLDVLKGTEAESIDCCITSPPYWGLRSYSTNPQVWGGDSECAHVFGEDIPLEDKRDRWATFEGYRTDGGGGKRARDNMATHGNTCQLCNAWRGELGLEPTFQLYITHLQEIFDEVYRVLKKTGTCFVNLGDTYGGTGDKGNWRDPKYKEGRNGQTVAINKSAPSKSLCNIPFRFAISMTDHGWIQRNTIIWHKPSCMPSSAKDRFTVDFEYVFFFVKQKSYWFEQQFDAMGNISKKRYDHPFRYTPKEAYPDNRGNSDSEGFHKYNPQGRNKRAVWRINPQPFKDAHFAVFPEKLVEPMVQAGCPSEICDSCGAAHMPIQTPTGNRIPTGHFRKSKRGVGMYHQDNKGSCFHDAMKNETKLDIKKCDCNSTTHAGIVLDPFVGSGTTALVARKLGRHYIGIDLQPDYCDMAEKRIKEML